MTKVEYDRMLSAALHAARWHAWALRDTNCDNLRYWAGRVVELEQRQAEPHSPA